jgi:asparagine synthase (glutamine-hydrolysing)
MCSLAGGPADIGLLGRMMESLSHRGQDGRGVQVKGRVGMGHLLHCTTPESQAERQPLASDDGAYLITSQARLDNREELVPELGLASLAAAPDAAIILAAYRRWGAASAQRLVGTFAFAIWDAPRQQLFCARDPIGLCPFHYHLGNDRFLWASEIRALLVDRDTSLRVNEEKVTDYLVGNYYGDPAETFYRDIWRLPPGHWLQLEPDGRVEVRAYWDLSGALPDAGLREEECVERFSMLLEQAVRSQLRSLTPVGVWTSGGIDSSAVVATAERVYRQGGSERHVVPICAVFDQLAAVDERRWMSALVEHCGLDMQPVPCDERMSFSRGLVPDSGIVPDEPLGGKHAEVVFGLLGKSRELGTRVVFTGDGSDVMLQGNYCYLADLLRGGRLLALARALSRYRERWGVLLRWAVRPILRSWYRSVRVAARRGAGGLAAAALPPWLAPGRRRRAGERYLAAALPVRFRNLSDQEEYAAYSDAVRSNQAIWLQDVALQYGIEMRHPFYDLRLLSFLFTIPAALKLAGGAPKAILRRAMEGVVPDSIRLPGPERGSFHPVLDRGLQVLLQGGLRDRLCCGPLVTQGYATRSGLEELIEQYEREPARRHELGRVVQLDQWLRYVSGAPCHQGGSDVGPESLSVSPALPGRGVPGAPPASAWQGGNRHRYASGIRE